MKDKEKALDTRRVYYDHEPAYEQIAEAGGEGWDDLPQSSNIKDDSFGSYESLKRFLKSDELPAPTTVLELGCGGGQASFMLAERGFEATGVDFSETAIKIARRNADRRGLECRFERADVTDLSDFDSGSFGLVLDNHCLHCLIEDDDRAAMITEAFRVLKPGGLFFIDTMSCEGDYDPELMGVDEATGINEHRTRRWVSEERLRGEVESAGFQIAALHSRPEEPGTGDLLTMLARRPE